MGHFLQGMPPFQAARVENAFVERHYNLYVDLPAIQLYCHHSLCLGMRFFTAMNQIEVQQHTHAAGSVPKKLVREFVTYRCKNCSATDKIFAIELRHAGKHADVFKFGEVPAFGPPNPAKLISLVRPDRDLYVKGRQCETQGLGIAAFSYYRRVIENQRHRIFDEIIRVLSSVSPGHPAIADLQAARAARQFAQSVEAIKHALPDSLMIAGRDPLRLLHGALSVGIHALSDEECLERATAIRTVLSEFAVRLSDVMKDDAELTAAVAKLTSIEDAVRSGSGSEGDAG
ncbi:hypothetical protein [Pseudoxanthomonas indica]|uniref:Uncharacterized protein n=1 Tax=Pseudoxanthomonas indica TaxID=428993 RepID=A0A1T5JCN5_9GAMM|nr:hypothetical protein [Pseudoxanthomonas indica]SKC49200.1 hypothetical protein SAMN06296058_0700 [Pseudoxanthomonas indica]